NKTVIANFQGYRVTISASGNGEVSVSPNENLFPPNTTIHVTAVPDWGNDFAFWTGNVTGSENPLTVIMDADKNIRGVFAPTTVAITIQGEGSVARNPDRAYYRYSEQVILSPVPARW